MSLVLPVIMFSRKLFRKFCLKGGRGIHVEGLTEATRRCLPQLQFSFDLDTSRLKDLPLCCLLDASPLAFRL